MTVPGVPAVFMPRPEPLLVVGIADLLEPDMRPRAGPAENGVFPVVGRVDVGDLERRRALLQQGDRSADPTVKTSSPPMPGAGCAVTVFGPQVGPAAVDAPTGVAANAMPPRTTAVASAARPDRRGCQMDISVPPESISLSGIFLNGSRLQPLYQPLPAVAAAVQYEPRPPSNAGTVLARMYRSIVSDQFST